MITPAIAMFEIMDLALIGDIFVLRDNKLHAILRKKCRTLYRQGQLEFVSNGERGFTYRITDLGRSRHLHNQLKKALYASQSQE